MLSQFRYVARRTEGRARVLEIGCYVGVSLCTLLTDYFPHGTATALDWFQLGSEDEPELLGNLPEGSSVPTHDDLLQALRENVHHAGVADRVRLFEGDSKALLPQLLEDEGACQYDLVIVDGSHKAEDVYADALWSWRLLRPGGTMVLDDFEYIPQSRPPPHERPKAGLVHFLRALQPDEFKVVYVGYRLFLRKAERTPLSPVPLPAPSTVSENSCADPGSHGNSSVHVQHGDARATSRPMDRAGR